MLKHVLRPFLNRKSSRPRFFTVCACVCRCLATADHFPDAFYGTNTKIRDTLNSLILKNVSSWQTSVALPFVKIEGTSVEWDEIHFDVRLMQRVPNEGVSRMQTSLR